MVKVGSLFSGYGGLDLAAEALFGARTVWHVEFDAAPSKILAHHWPDVPNYGDVTTVDWAEVEPVDVLTGGYPCQPFSAAGKRKGTNDDRHLWPYVREAIRHLRPRYVLLENVAGHRSLGFDRVLGDMAEDGLNVRWTSLRASDIGAPHHRERIFILATPADAEGERSGERIEPQLGRVSPAARRGSSDDSERVGAMPADADGLGLGQGSEQSVAGSPEESAAVGDLGALPGDRRTDDLLTDRWGVPLCQTCSDALRNRLGGSWQCPDPNVCGNQNDPFPPDDWYDDNDRLVLPTPMAQHSGNTPENHLRKKPGRKAVTDLAILVENNLFDTGGVPVLPTPTVGNATGTNERRGGARSGEMLLPGVAVAAAEGALLPTPRSSRGGSATETMYAFGAVRDDTHRPQGEVVLPTPRAHQRGDCPSEQDRKSPDLGSVGFHFTPERWGKYAPAIHRWEQATRPAPAPTEPNSNGKPRLAAAFAEWMMGLPTGHVTDPAIGISRAEQLKAIGNGVCPQQAYAAGVQLLAMEVKP